MTPSRNRGKQAQLVKREGQPVVFEPARASDPLPLARAIGIAFGNPPRSTVDPSLPLRKVNLNWL